MEFTGNVGRLDRAVRAVIAGALFYLAIFFPDIANDVVSSTLLLLVGALLVAVALFGSCPVYRLLDIDTRSVSHGGSGQ